MNSNEIIVEHRTMYGKHHFYPINELAKELLKFIDPRAKSKRVAFSPEQMRIAKKLGMNITITQKEVELDI